MKIPKSKTKRILMSILLCGVMSGSVYAEGERITVNSGDTYEDAITGTYSGLGGSGYNNGGAIENSGTISIIGDATGGDATVFATNSANRYGGAIYNTGNITSIANVNFTENNTISTSSSYGGGAIYNSSSGTIESITGTLSGEGDEVTSTSIFTGNTGRDGGAIFNAGTIGSIANIIFTENEAVSSNYGGGAIYNTGGITSIENCIFSGNEASSVYGGAIYNNSSGTISSITGTAFTGNTAANGGAIANRSTQETPIGSITDCTFTENTASGNGGAIYSNPGSGSVTINSITGSTFTGNTSGSHGGAIYISATTNIGSIVNTTFSGNIASGDGGAIYSGGSTISSIEGVIFDTNAASGNGGAIRNYGTITTIKSYEDDNGATVNTTFTGNTASGSNGGGAIYNYSGAIIGTIGEGTVFTGNKATNGSGGAIYNAQNSVISSITGNTFSGNTAENGDGGAIYNYKYGEIKSITGNTFTGNAAKGGNGGAIENAEPESVIGEISGNTFTKNTAAAGGAAIYNEGSIESITGNTFTENQAGTYGGAIYNNGGTITELSGDTFTGNSAVSESGEAAGGAIYNSGTISTFSVQTLSGNYAEGTTSAMGGAIYDEASTITVTGDVTDNYATASSGEAKGGAIYAGEGTVVTLNGNITGNYAKGDTAQGGAIYNAGTVNINIENKDAVISGNYTESGGTQEANVLYGEAGSVTNFSLTDASLTLEDSLTGDTGFAVNVTGNGTDSTTFYMLNDILDSNLSFSGTTVNTINNEVKAYSVNKLSISGNVNFVADVDMANETMDRFTASEYGDHAGKLNVSGMNLISDTEKDSVDIYFAEEGLKDSVTSSVGTLPDSKNQQKAYTPLYQYNVAYDNRSDGGYFTFDKAGNNPSADVPEEGEAAAISFMNLMYRYAFEHSDYYMKLPKKVRLAIMKGEEGEAEKEFKNYNGHNLTDPGIWVKPFASNETVPFSHQFTARTKNYGLLVGIDTAFKEKGKWANVFTGYAGYDGIKQTFDGNSTEQYGGVVGVTDTLYKGNFYAALTLSGGENVLKAKTMYGREKTHLYMAGAAVKTGYNLEFAGGNYSFLPTFMASYTYADIKDYTSASGLRMDSDGMHAVELNPNFKFIRNLASGWMPYVTVGEIWTVGQHSKVRASGTELDELTFRPYTEYGLGVQKMWSKGYDGYAEFLGHAGGRRGFLVNLGFRWTFN